MKFFTQKQFDKYTADLIESNYNEGKEDGYQKGYKEGYVKGNTAGLIADKSGVLMNESGLFVFENAAVKLASKFDITE